MEHTEGAFLELRKSFPPCGLWIFRVHETVAFHLQRRGRIEQFYGSCPAPAPLQRKNKSHSHSRLTRPGRDVTLPKFKQTARGLRQLPNAKNFADPHIPYHVPIRCSSISDGGASRQRKSVANAPPRCKRIRFQVGSTSDWLNKMS